MKFWSLKKLFFAAILLNIPFQSMAWGMLGHRVVAHVAESYLTKKASREVKNILGNESLAMASNWADFIKSEPAFDYLGNWHYINLPKGMSTEQIEKHLQNDTTTNAYTRINFLSSELKNKSLEQDKKVMYLKILIHLVGDIHQPMHTGRVEDQGGNKVQLKWFGQNTNLHRVWDSDLIDYQNLSYTEYAQSINFLDKNRLHSLQQEAASQWVIDSYKISEKLYSGVKTDDKLSYRYIYDHIDIANQQMLKGGVHLAALLNDIFKN